MGYSPAIILWPAGIIILPMVLQPIIPVPTQSEVVYRTMLLLLRDHRVSTRSPAATTILQTDRIRPSQVVREILQVILVLRSVAVLEILPAVIAHLLVPVKVTMRADSCLSSAAEIITRQLFNTRPWVEDLTTSLSISAPSAVVRTIR